LITTGFERECIILSSEINNNDMTIKLLFVNYMFKKMNKIMSEISECPKCKNELGNILYFDMNNLVCEDCGKSDSIEFYKEQQNSKIIYIPKLMTNIENIKLFCRILLPIEYGCSVDSYVCFSENECAEIRDTNVTKYNVKYPENRVYFICQSYPGKFEYKLPWILKI